MSLRCLLVSMEPSTIFTGLSKTERALWTEPLYSTTTNPTLDNLLYKLQAPYNCLSGPKEALGELLAQWNDCGKGGLRVLGARVNFTTVWCEEQRVGTFIVVYLYVPEKPNVKTMHENVDFHLILLVLACLIYFILCSCMSRIVFGCPWATPNDLMYIAHRRKKRGQEDRKRTFNPKTAHPCHCFWCQYLCYEYKCHVQYPSSLKKNPNGK